MKLFKVTGVLHYNEDGEQVSHCIAVHAESASALAKQMKREGFIASRTGRSVIPWPPALIEAAE